MLFRSRIGARVSREAASQICANGAGIPCIGFGTFGMRGAKLKGLLIHAIRAGFRHIDTAQVYGNEDAVGEGVQASGIPRDDVFITTKVWVENYSQARFDRSVDGRSLKALRTDYIDLLMLNWPSSPVPLEAQIECLNLCGNCQMCCWFSANIMTNRSVSSGQTFTGGLSHG